MKKRGAGRRAALSKADRKAAIFSVRLSQEERDRVEHAAQAMGLKAAAWARLVLLNASSPPQQPS